jgi:SAM-dependent methyltransferase
MSNIHGDVQVVTQVTEAVRNSVCDPSFSSALNPDANDYKGMVNRTIHPLDNMYNHDPDWYFPVGRSGLEAIYKMINLAGKPHAAIRTILDLPCGHGRVGRYLRAAFPSAEITFSDLDESGVEFCAQEFQGKALPSRPQVSDVAFTTTFDLIWIGSLFTHFGLQETEVALKHLCSCLSPDGILVATFHGPWSVEWHNHTPLIGPEGWTKILQGYELGGYGYASYDGSGTIGGISIKAEPHC